MSLPPLNSKMVSVEEACLEAQQVGKGPWHLHPAQGSPSPCCVGKDLPSKSKTVKSFVSGKIPKTKKHVCT